MATPLQLDTAGVRRRELAGFLRSRRERLTPEQVGLTTSGRRRTPGLRREEVAQLAGVGVTWYTWLEQARDINVSEQVLGAIAGTLRLDPYERAHLFTLAGAPAPKRDQDCRAIPAGVHAMMRKLEPYPALVMNAKTDILAYNRAYDYLMDVERVPIDDRNAVLLAFTEPRWRARMPDWSDRMVQMVGQLRANMATHVGDPSWKALVKRLRQESPDFEELWQRHDIQPMVNLTKRFLHPALGMLHLDYTYVWLGKNSDLRMTTYTPSDNETEAKLRTLAR